MPSTAHRRRRLALGAVVAVLASMVTVLGVSLTPASADTAPVNPNDPRTPKTIAADGLPTAQINGVVWTQVVVGNIVYAGGNFTKARPAGVPLGGPGEVDRSYLLAYNITTGELVSSFAPVLNAQVRTLTVSPDQKRLYVGGDFTSADGDAVKRLIAYDIATGTRIKSFTPNMVYNVHSVQATNTTVWAGGNFTAVGTKARAYLAAFTSGGALLDWAPQANNTVDAMVLSPDASKIVVGGRFTTMNGSSNPGYGLAMLDTTTGTSLPLPVNSTVRDGGTDGSITSLRSDGTYFYGSGYTFGASGGNLEGVFQAPWDTGALRWLEDCHGDSYDVVVHQKVVYSVGHAHYCENIDGFPENASDSSRQHYRAVAFGTDPTQTITWEPNQGRYTNFAGTPAPSMLTWFPRLTLGTFTGQSQAAWSLAANNNYVVAGGEFPKVNNVAQQGLVRFAVSSIAPNKRGPLLFNTTYPLNITSTEAGKVRVNWTSNNDDDNRNLTYRLYRDVQTNAGLVYSGDQLADWWNPYTTGFSDSVAPGSTHQYRVSVIDAFGNVANSPWTQVTAASSGSDSAYVRAVQASQPTDWWRFDDTGGAPNVVDQVGFRPGTTYGGVTRGQGGAIANDGGSAYSFNGSSTGFMATPSKAFPPDEFTVEAWIKTGTNRGGKIIGWGSSATSTSSKADRHLYMDNQGRIYFGVKPNASRVTVNSTSTYRDNQWHYVAGTLSPAGMSLYVDGQKVAGRVDVTNGEHLNPGYWRVGGDTLNGWTNAPSSGYFNGTIDEPAVYTRALTASEISTHYDAGKGTVSDIAPTAAFSWSATGLDAAFDGSSSVDTEGPIASYDWNYGDGQTGTGPTANHTYTAAGTYDVTLTVTDSAGQTGTLTKQVQVVKANTAPTADFSSSTADLTATFDGSASSDAEGPIASYAWTFGDGSSGTGVNPSHPYASGGTYNVKLTVTDSGGLTSSVTKSVTVSPAAVNQAPNASFSSSTSGLVASFDGTGSSDSDGSIASWSWNYGDGSPVETGSTPSHTYAGSGTYPVTLTVTDDDGATGSVTKNVVVTDGTPLLLSDQFGRSTASGWGTADQGGIWSVIGTVTNYVVDAGTGIMKVSAGGERRSYLGDVQVRDVDARVSATTDKPATGGGLHIGLELRRQASSNDRYSVRALVKSDNTVTLVLGKFVGGLETVLATRVTGLTVAPGDVINIRGQAVGNGTTAINGKIWLNNNPEPATWTGMTSDASPSLQLAGSVGLRSYLSGSATNAPIAVSFDNLTAQNAP